MTGLKACSIEIAADASRDILDKIESKCWHHCMSGYSAGARHLSRWLQKSWTPSGRARNCLAPSSRRTITSRSSSTGSVDSFLIEALKPSWPGLFLPEAPGGCTDHRDQHGEQPQQPCRTYPARRVREEHGMGQTSNRRGMIGRGSGGVCVDWDRPVVRPLFPTGSVLGRALVFHGNHTLNRTVRM